MKVIQWIIKKYTRVVPKVVRPYSKTPIHHITFQRWEDDYDSKINLNNRLIKYDPKGPLQRDARLSKNIDERFMRVIPKVLRLKSKTIEGAFICAMICLQQ